MTLAYPIQGPTRVCSATNRGLGPGEKFYSVLLEEKGTFVRKDYAVDAWPGPPAGAIAYWTGRIPASDRQAKPTINDELLLDCFTHLANATEPAQLNFRYVLALLLMRRKRLRFEDVREQEGREFLNLRDSRSGERHEAYAPRLSEEEMSAVQDEVFRVLGWE